MSKLHRIKAARFVQLGPPRLRLPYFHNPGKGAVRPHMGAWQGAWLISRTCITNVRRRLEFHVGADRQFRVCLQRCRPMHDARKQLGNHTRTGMAGRATPSQYCRRSPTPSIRRTPSKASRSPSRRTHALALREVYMRKR
jgi:hypothetical protein